MNPYDKRFKITIKCEVVLEGYDLWVDNDAPACPTPADVEDLINRCGGPLRVLTDWNFEDDLTVEVTEIIDESP